MEYEDFELNEEQIRACKAVTRAISKASKLGIYILAKQDCLHGYSAKAYEKGLVAPLAETHEFDYNHPVQYVEMGRIVDSGADDTEFFKKGSFDY